MRSFPIATSFVLGTVMVLFGSMAHGQSSNRSPLGGGFNLSRADPAPAGDKFTFVPEPRIRSMVCDKTEGTIPIRDAPTGTAPVPGSCDDPATWIGWNSLVSAQHVNLVEDHPADVVRLHLGASWAPARIYQLSLTIPLNFYQTDSSTLSQGYATPVSSQRVGMQPDVLDVSDVRFGVRFAWPVINSLRAGVQGYLFLPTGDPERLMGDAGLRADLLGLASIGKTSERNVAYTVAAYAGVGRRPSSVLISPNRHWGGKAGIAVSIDAIHGWKWVMPVVEARVDQLRKGQHIPADLSIGARIRPSDKRTLWFNLLGTAGLSEAPGVPLYGLSLNLTVVPWTY